MLHLGNIGYHFLAPGVIHMYLIVETLLDDDVDVLIYGRGEHSAGAPATVGGQIRPPPG
jgi:hypothetical protein